MEIYNCPDSNNSSMYAFIKGSSSVISSVTKSLNVYIPKSIKGEGNPFKVSPPPLMTFLEGFIFNTNDIIRYLPRIIQHTPLVDS